MSKFIAAFVAAFLFLVSVPAVANDAVDTMLPICKASDAEHFEDCFDRLIELCGSEQVCTLKVYATESDTRVLLAETRAERAEAALEATTATPAEPVVVASGSAVPVLDGTVTVTAFDPTSGRLDRCPLCLAIDLFETDRAFMVVVDGEIVPVQYRDGVRPQPVLSPVSGGSASFQPLWTGSGERGQLVATFDAPGRYSVAIVEFFWNPTKMAWQERIRRTGSYDIGKKSGAVRTNNRSGV